jgi:hypothetical protein
MQMWVTVSLDTPDTSQRAYTVYVGLIRVATTSDQKRTQVAKTSCGAC